MLKSIITNSSTLLAFIAALQITLSKPQRQHVLNNDLRVDQSKPIKVAGLPPNRRKTMSQATKTTFQMASWRRSASSTARDKESEYQNYKRPETIGSQALFPAVNHGEKPLDQNMALVNHHRASNGL